MQYWWFFLLARRRIICYGYYLLLLVLYPSEAADMQFWSLPAFFYIFSQSSKPSCTAHLKMCQCSHNLCISSSHFMLFVFCFACVCLPLLWQFCRSSEACCPSVVKSSGLFSGTISVLHCRSTSVGNTCVAERSPARRALLDQSRASCVSKGTS